MNAKGVASLTGTVATPTRINSVRSLFPDDRQDKATIHYRCKLIYLTGEATVYVKEVTLGVHRF